MNFSFTGKRALVTGAGKGIGRCIAKALVDGGAHTIALSRTAADLDSLKHELPAMETHQCDVADWDAARTLIESLGHIDLLVNNAGVASLQSALDTTPEEYDRVFNTNVKAVMNISQVVAKSLISQASSGSIVNISSVASSLALQDHLVYCSSKAALDQMTRVMAMEWGPHQIRVNCVNPTVVLTPMGKQAWENEAGDALKARIPQRKFAREEDVVNAVLFLLSDKADMITGTTLPIDGGLLTS